MSVTQRKINGRTFAVYTEVADHMDALAARLAEAERLLQWVDDQGRLDARDAFDFREMHAKYKTRATDSADEVQT